MVVVVKCPVVVVLVISMYLVPSMLSSEVMVDLVFGRCSVCVSLEYTHIYTGCIQVILGNYLS